jgi:serine/threonine protein kinase
MDPRNQYGKDFAEASQPPVLKYAYGVDQRATPAQPSSVQPPEGNKLAGMGGLFFTDGEEGSISNLAQANILGRKWLLNYKELVIGEKLASGSSGQVFRGTFCGMPVAVKNLYVAVEHMGVFLEGNDSSEEEWGRGEANGKGGKGRGGKGKGGRGALPAKNTPPTGDLDGGDDGVGATVREFVSETKILSRLRHDNVVRFYGVCHHLQDLYIVQELCACSLRDITYHRLARIRAKAQRLLQTEVVSKTGGGRGKKGSSKGRQKAEEEPGLTVNEVVLLLRQVACGMAYVHAKGLIHRDLKPANLLLDRPPPSMAEDGSEQQGNDKKDTKDTKGKKEGPEGEGRGRGKGKQDQQQDEGAPNGDAVSDPVEPVEAVEPVEGIGIVKICDFGLARWWAHTKTGREATMTGCGTPFYMAPELIMGHR